jgi:hypothetical protein
MTFIFSASIPKIDMHNYTTRPYAIALAPIEAESPVKVIV